MPTTTSWNVIDKSLGSVGGNNNECVAGMMTKEIADVRIGTAGVAGGDETAAAPGTDGLAIRPTSGMLVEVKEDGGYLMKLLLVSDEVRDDVWSGEGASPRSVETRRTRRDSAAIGSEISDFRSVACLPVPEEPPVVPMHGT